MIPVDTKNPGELLAQVINLARECHCVDFILPLAFHLLIAHPEAHKIIQALPLSSEDRTIAFSGWFNEVKEQDVDTMHWLMQHDRRAAGLFQNCNSPGDCREVRFNLIQSNFLPIPKVFGLCPWKSLSVTISKHLCGSCVAAAQKSHCEGRERFWQKLPTFFVLPGWEELLQEH